MAFANIALCRELGNSSVFHRLVKGESLPGNLSPQAMKAYVHNSAVTYWHQCCTAKMGRDAMSVVNSRLKVYGIDRLRLADASILPNVPSGNTMAPCVVIGERTAHMIKADHRL